jgi:hypothetical protein
MKVRLCLIGPFAVTMLSGCVTPSANTGNVARFDYIQCLADYIHASNLVNHTPSFEESGSEDFCGPQERLYRTQIEARASRVSERERRETADIVISQTWQEIRR